MSDMRFVQNIGRGLRASKGKTDLLILDHSTTTMRLGMVDEVYALHKELDDGKAKAAAKVGVMLPKECAACHYLKPPRMAKCPNCGHVQEAHAKPVPVQRGTLREIKAESERADLLRSLPDKAHVYGQLLWWAAKKGYKEGWAANKYREIFQVWPRGLDHADKVDAPVPALVEYIYRSTEKWKRANAYAKRNAERNAWSGRVWHRKEPLPEPVAPHVPGTLCTEEDLEEFK